MFPGMTVCVLSTDHDVADMQAMLRRNGAEVYVVSSFGWRQLPKHHCARSNLTMSP